MARDLGSGSTGRAVGQDKRQHQLIRQMGVHRRAGGVMGEQVAAGRFGDRLRG